VSGSARVTHKGGGRGCLGLLRGERRMQQQRTARHAQSTQARAAGHAARTEEASASGWARGKASGAHSKTHGGEREQIKEKMVSPIANFN
jgi:hypothetical protein